MWQSGAIAIESAAEREVAAAAIKERDDKGDDDDDDAQASGGTHHLQERYSCPELLSYYFQLRACVMS